MFSRPRLHRVFLGLGIGLVLGAGAMGWTLVVAGNPWQRLVGAVAVAGMTALALEALQLLFNAVWRLTGRTRLRLACRTLARLRRRSR